MVEPLVKGGRITEYGAHLTAEGGLHMVPPKLYGDGILIIGDAAGFTINSGLVIRGMDLAIGSGIMAADAMIEAKEKSDFSAETLSAYQCNLDNSFIMKDLKLYAKVPEFMETDRLYQQYATMVTTLFSKAYTHDLTPKEHLSKAARASLKASGISLFNLAKDGIMGVRAL
jgi:electron transfer flavoprotein-quinone oxidoreductase